MSLTKVSYSMITGAPVNVLDYGADPTGTVDSSDAINAALATNNHVYIPKGLYKLDSALTPKSNQTISGDGVNATVLSANTVGMTCISYPSGFWSNVVIQNLSINGNSKSERGIEIIASAQGTVSNCTLSNVNLSDHNLYNVHAEMATYCTFDRVNTANGQYGIFLRNCFDVLISNSTLYEASQACLINYLGSQNKFTNCHIFNGLVPATSLVIVDGGSGITFNSCSFEPTGTNSVTYEVLLKATGSGLNSVPADILFNDCRFIGLAHTKTNCVYVGTVGTAYKVNFEFCQFIKPVASSIVLGAQQYTSITYCVDLVSYDTAAYAPVSVTNSGGNPYYQENLPGNFVNSLSALSVTGTSFVATGTVSTRWISGTGSPEGVVVAAVGCLYSRTDGGAGSTLYVKESGIGNTGWAAK